MTKSLVFIASVRFSQVRVRIVVVLVGLFLKGGDTEQPDKLDLQGLPERPLMRRKTFNTYPTLPKRDFPDLGWIVDEFLVSGCDSRLEEKVVMWNFPNDLSRFY